MRISDGDIYGSRAANGAILITTKKGRYGAMRWDLNLYSGTTSPARDIQLLNTQQYLAMRREAFQNDAELPSGTDYDVNGTWDSTRYTNWSKVLTKNTTNYTDGETSVSGGTANTQWLIGGGYNRQTTGFRTLIPGDGSDQKASVHINMNSISTDKKFRIALTASYVSDKNRVQSEDFSNDRFYLAPNSPALFNSDGSLNWAPTAPGL